LEAGEGSTDAEKAVKRINVDDLLNMRLNFLAPPSSWEAEDGTKPPPACLWDSPTRVSEIEEAAKAPRIGGDVSRDKKKAPKKNPNDTAPALEDCKPLEVNEETRWKAKVMDGKENKANDEEVESKDEILRKATLILNKLSLTKFDKLSDEFINCGIGRDVETLTGAVGLIVNYAQEQQHFSSMYAGLCLKLANTPMEGIDEGSKKGKKFKKILLQRCQDEFETDTATKIKAATEGITEKEEIEYHANLIKKHYLGHMRFIGELYKGDLISIKIMLFCLPALLKGESDDESSNDVDEEKVECFSKLMTVIGSSLEQQSEAMRSVGKADAAENLAECWRTVEIMAGKRQEEGPKVSNRIKFMLQDLLEMKAKGWVTRRKEETAKTIAQIHKEVAKEERAAARRSSSSASLRGKGGSIRRGASSGDVRVLDKQQNKPQVDEDGFVSVAPSSKGFNRSASMSMMGMRTQSKDSLQKYNTRGSVTGPSMTGGRKPSSGKFAVLNESDSNKSNKKESKQATSPAKEEKPKTNYPTPDECGDKAKNIMKEYFVGGDTDDAVLSIHELVGAGSDGSVDRGTKVVEAGVLLVLEMKASDVEKFLNVYLRCAKEKKIESQSFITGLNDPLEFLSDVAIDAPLAIPHLAGIVAELVKAEIIPFGFLLDSPEYFRTDQNAADFGGKVLKKIGGDATSSQDHIDVIDKLMTCEDKAKHSSAADLIAEA
jgi:translation initiation factor 4G